MKNKLAGHFPLQDMIASVIERARGSVQEKTASAQPAAEDKKDVQVVEKTAGVIIVTDPDEVEKLASALDFAAEELTKEADYVANGSESKQGGQQLPVQSPTSGTQPAPAGKATESKQPKTGLKATKDNPGPANAIKTDDESAPGASKGKQKVSGVENGGESPQGGQQLSNTAPVPSLPGKQLIKSPEAITNATKREAKAQPKKELKAVLTEPALTKAHDKVVHQALRNADKGGVKIAAARTLIEKIAGEGCKCNKEGSCQHCKLTKAMSEMKPASKDTSEE